MNNNSISKVGLLLTLSVLLSACGGGKKEVAAEPTNDITRPPLVEKVSAPQEEAVAEGELKADIVRLFLYLLITKFERFSPNKPI